MGAHGELFGHSVHLLVLHEHEAVGRRVVLVHIHIVVQVLETGGRGHKEAFWFIAQAQTCVQHVATIVVHKRGGGVFYLTFLHIINPVWEGVLPGELVVGSEIGLETGRQFPDQVQLGTGFIAPVIHLVEVGILVKTVQTLIETCHRESKVIGGTVEMRHFDTALETAS